MRYLTRQFTIGALRRGPGIEQFPGGTEVDGEPAIRWVAISTAAADVEDEQQTHAAGTVPASATRRSSFLR
ncbi:hypothetical protein [Actinoplanes philippinensis]|uniref:hypothetical protein n=1 Tax=Actinoplanes philippinensis TaxID=35752 RepID=UPI0033DD6C0F